MEALRGYKIGDWLQRCFRAPTQGINTPTVQSTELNALKFNGQSNQLRLPASHLTMSYLCFLELGLLTCSCSLKYSLKKKA